MFRLQSILDRESHCKNSTTFPRMLSHYVVLQIVSFGYGSMSISIPLKK